MPPLPDARADSGPRPRDSARPAAMPETQPVRPRPASRSRWPCGQLPTAHFSWWVVYLVKDASQLIRFILVDVTFRGAQSDNAPQVSARGQIAHEVPLGSVGTAQLIQPRATLRAIQHHANFLDQAELCTVRARCIIHVVDKDALEQRDAIVPVHGFKVAREVSKESIAAERRPLHNGQRFVPALFRTEYLGSQRDVALPDDGAKTIARRKGPRPRHRLIFESDQRGLQFCPQRIDFTPDR